MKKSQPKKLLLDEVRDIMRRGHYSIHTERSYYDWIKRYVSFHKMQSRADLANKEGKVKRNVASSTQNRSMTAKRQMPQA